MSSGLVLKQPASSSSSSLELREKQAKIARREQLKKHQEREARIADPEKPRTSKVTFESRHALIDAVHNLDIDQMREILTSDSASPDTVSEATGVSLLHLCCLNNYLPGVQCLLEHGANINIQDNDLWTPLHVATACGHMEIIQLLLESNADCTLLDVDRNFACDSSHDPNIREVLVKHMSINGIEESDMRFLRSSMAMAMLAAVKECIMRMMDLNLLNQNGVAPLHVAAANGYRVAAKLLLDLGGADVNREDDLGYTSLHIAAKYNQTKLVYLLLSKGADASLQGPKLELPIDMTDDDEIIGLLELAGGDEGSPIHASILPIIVPLTPSSVDTVSVDLEQFETPQTTSKSIDLETPMSKLEALFEGETLVERDNFDEGVDVSTQRPALRRLRGSLLQKRASGNLILPGPSSTDNLATLSDLTEDIILLFLGNRYGKDQIYTYIGEILVAINPFKPLSIYSNMASEMYSKKIPDPSLPPHVFAVANQVYRSMLAEQRRQTCVISGESGAGKTETSKHLVQQLLFISHSVEKELNLKIEQVNPILETFGNAKTVMNNNSSRFGKFLELSFNEEGLVLGASFKEYLLEKSRIVTHGEGERNFHIFYQMFAGLSIEEKEMLKLDEPEMHRCLSGIRESLVGVLTSKMEEEFKEVRDSLEAIGFSKQEESNMFQTLAAVVHILDVTFDPREEGMGLSNPSLTSVIAGLLQIDPRELALCLVQEAMITRGEVIVRHRSLLQANDCRDALAKALYGRMFGWIVNGINHHLEPEDTGHSHHTRIGVLDIFGFENFEKNSFEQMCINIANEQLQHFFNEHIFRWEQVECQNEGVATDTVTFASNLPVVDLFLAKNIGILSLIDEESRFPRATDRTLAEKLHKAHGECEMYQAPPDNGTKFEVSHYAGQVKYEVVGFLDKNRDTLSPSVLQLLRTSSSLLVREIFEAKLTHTGSTTPSKRQRMSRRADSPFSHFNRKASRRLTRLSRKNPQRSPVRKSADTGRRVLPTVANHFKSSLSELMEKLNSSSPHFIRCIKPNSTKLPNSFNTDYVIRQLRCVGVMETTRIRQSGYPVRFEYGEFLTRFRVLKEFYTYQPNQPPLTDYQAVGVVLGKVGVSGWANGLHKVFLKFNHPLELDRHSQHVLLHIISIQRWFRELKEWKSAQEARRIKQAKRAELSSSANQVHKNSSSATSKDMTHYKGNGHQEGWDNGHQHVSSAQNVGKNSNDNNSRGQQSIPQGYGLSTSPPSYGDCLSDDDVIDEDIYDTVVELNFTSIKSLPLSKDIILASLPQQQNDYENIYDSAEGAVQTVSEDYYNYNDEDNVDDIYDDLTCIQAKDIAQSIPVDVIEEDIYDDTCVDVFRSLHATCPDAEEIYDDASSAFEQPPPPRLFKMHAKPPPPLPPSSVALDEVYSDAATVFHSPPARTVTPTFKGLMPVVEDEALYTDATTLFDAPPVPIRSQVNSHSPKFSEIAHEYPTETYSCLSDLELNEPISSVDSRIDQPAPPPIPSRTPNLRKLGKATSVPTVSEVLPNPSRRTSEQLSVSSRIHVHGNVKPPPSPNTQRAVTRTRSKAIKSRVHSESDLAANIPLTTPRQSHSSGGSVGGDESRLSSTGSYNEVFSPTPRESKYHSEPSEKFLLPTIPAGVTVTHYGDGPAEEDYAEIDDCQELSYYESNTPQDYLTPVKQKPHRKLQISRSTGDMIQRHGTDHQSINSRPKAPLPREALNGAKVLDNRPPKPPRARSTSVSSGPNTEPKPSVPPVPERSAPLSDVPTVPPPPVPSRHARLADTPTIAPPPRPVRKTPVSPQSSSNAQAPPIALRAPPRAPPSNTHVVPPPPPPPPPQQAHTSRADESTSSSGLLSGLQSVQLKKSTRPPLKPSPKLESGSPGNLMAEMQTFKLRNITPNAPAHPAVNGIRSRPKSPNSDGSTHSVPHSSMPSLKPRHKKPQPPLPGRQITQQLPLDGHEVSLGPKVPEWKRSILEKKKRENEEILGTEQDSEAKWAGVPAWKRKIIEERASKKQ